MEKVIELILGFGAGLILIVIWIVFFPDDNEEVKEHKKWIEENWERAQK